jgi:hypothetical protein
MNKMGNAKSKAENNFVKLVEDYPIIMISFGCALLIFFAVIDAAINQDTNQDDLHKWGLGFGSIGVIVSTLIVILSVLMLKPIQTLLYRFGRRQFGKHLGKKR